MQTDPMQMEASFNFLHFCHSAFFDSVGRPCLIGVTAVLPVANFPLTYPSLTIAAGLNVPKNQVVKVTLEIGVINGPSLRWATFNLKSRSGVA